VTEGNINNIKSSQHPRETILGLLINKKDSSDTKKIVIEDFIDFDKNNLAEYRILYSLFGEGWYWFYNVALKRSELGKC
jgi:hypothetical protein